MKENYFDMSNVHAAIHGDTAPAVDWHTCAIDLSRPVPPPQPLLIQTETELPMLHRRNISTVAASAKVGKTFLVSAIAAASLHDEGFMGLHCPKEGVKVLFVDTEMDISDTQAVTQRIHRLLNWQTDKSFPQLTALNLREYEKETRLSIVEAAISDLRPDLVLLDGIVDLCESFNEIAPSQKVVTQLTQWATTYDCHICTCLHVNKGTGELRGHLGAFLRQKGELTLLLTKQEGESPYIECKPIDSRRRPIEPFCFRINNEALPELLTPVPKPPKSPRLDKVFSEILPLPASMNNADLCKKLIEVCNIKERMAKYKISQALKDGIIEKSEAGFYHLPQKQIPNEDLPF
jgi:hypothetical protein